MIVTNPESLLSDRQKTVLQLIAQGWTNTYICNKIFVTPKTLAVDIGDIYSKYNLSTSQGRSRHTRVSLTLKYYSNPENSIPPPKILQHWEDEDADDMQERST